MCTANAKTCLLLLKNDQTNEAKNCNLVALHEYMFNFLQDV